MSELSIELIFFILGGIIFVGYFGEIVSKKYNIPSALLLLVLGFFLKFTNYIDTTPLIGIQPIFGSLALILIMFDGSLSMNIYNVVFKSAKSLSMSIVITLLSMVASVLILHYGFGFDPVLSAIFGSLAGGIGSTTTISIISGLDIPKNIKEFLTLESSLTDVFSIIFTLILTTALVTGVIDFQKIGSGIVSTFSIGAFLGFVIGILFITVLHKIKSEYGYIVTFGVILLLYAISGLFGGSGAISVLVFGILLGNEKEVKRIFRIKGDRIKAQIRKLQAEISFFVRTFFFVYLGLVVNFGSLQNLLIAAVLLVVFYGVRYLSVHAISKDSELYDHKRLLVSVNPRGLATAVLATYPLEQISAHISKGGTGSYYSKILTEANNLPEISFYFILLSIILTTILVPIAMNSKKSES